MSTPPKTVLVVDDDVHIVQIIKHKLENAGYRVVLATNGRFAYQVATRTDVNMIIADYQMPGGDGIELAKQVHGDPDLPEIPVVMITGHAHRLTAEHLAETNISCVLVKPFSPQTLMERVEAVLGEQADPRAVA